MGPWPPALSNMRCLTCPIGKTSCHPPVSEDSHRRWSCKGPHILGHYSPGRQTWVRACLWRYLRRQAPGIPTSQRWPCTVIPMFQGSRRHPTADLTLHQPSKQTWLCAWFRWNHSYHRLHGDEGSCFVQWLKTGNGSELHEPCAVKFIAVDTVVTHWSPTIVNNLDR